MSKLFPLHSVATKAPMWQLARGFTAAASWCCDMKMPVVASSRLLQVHVAGKCFRPLGKLCHASQATPFLFYFVANSYVETYG